MNSRTSLYDLIGQLRENYDEARFLNKQRIVDWAVDNYQKLLNSKEVISVCTILNEDFSENYSLDENIDNAIFDYLNQ